MSSLAGPRLAPLLAVVLLGTLGGSAAAQSSGGASGEVRSYLYRDNSGLTVVTGAATAAAQLSPRLGLLARLVVDHIDLEREVLDPADPGAAAQLTGHHHPDAVTSASAIAGGGGVARKQRYEGTAAVRLGGTVGQVPVTGQVLVRGGYERDYRSVSALVAGAGEIFERNTRIDLLLGLGRDSVRPIEAPPGPPGRFPAAQSRVNIGASVGQTLSPSAVARLGGSATFQRGMLSSPYRRAVVLPDGAAVGTLFPEVLPSRRQRYTAFAGGSFALGSRAALHLQQGAYADSWGVRALIPEVVLSRDFGLDSGRRPLVNIRYRYYAQGAASFHTDHYHAVEPRMSGDPRLGPTRDHTAGIELRWLLFPGATGERRLALEAGYTITVLDYRSDHTGRIIGHIPSLALAGAL